MAKINLPRRYTIRGLDKKYNSAISYYKKGLLVEAFALLYAITEAQLLAVFKFVLYDRLSIKIYEKLNLQHKWEYSQLIRVLNEMQVIKNEDYQKFKQFQDGRNKAIHELPLPGFHDKLNMKTLQSSFNSGMKSYVIARSLQQKLYSNEFAKINLNDPAERNKFIKRLQTAVKSAKKKRLV